MRLVALPALTLLALAACETARGIPTGTAGGAAMQNGNNPVPDGGIKFTRFEDMPPDLAAHIRRVMNDPAEIAKADRAAERERVPLPYALKSGPLPNGAIAAVLRNPNGEPRRALIFSESSFTYSALALARMALHRDESEVDEPTALRVLWVWPDQRVESGGESWNLNAHIGGGPPGYVDDLLAAPRSAPVAFPVVGTVRIIETGP